MFASHAALPESANKERAMLYAKTKKAWNDAGQATRQAMLVEAGYSKNTHYSRVFEHLPQWVRDDLIYCMKRKENHPQPPKTPKQTWQPYID